MGNSASAPTQSHVSRQQEPRSRNSYGPLVDLRKHSTGFTGASIPFIVSRTQCDAALPPPPLPPPTSADSKAAAGAAPPPPPPSSSPTSSPQEDAIAAAAAASSRYSNPGPYEQASLEAKRLVNIDTWEGFRCEVSKQMNPFMVVIHSFGMAPASAGGNPMLGAQPPSSYTMATQVGDENGVIVSRMDTARGGIDGRIQRLLLGGLCMGKLQLSLANADNDMILAEIDIGTTIPVSTWTANFKYGSMAGGPAWGMNYWQAITPNLSMGAEGMYIAAQGAAVTTYALKYNFQAPLTHEEQQEAETTRSTGAGGGPSQSHPGMPTPEVAGASSLCANFHGGNGMLTLNYRRVVTPARVVVGAELALPVMDPFQTPPDVLFGAEFNLTRSKLAFCVDGTTGKLQSVLEAKLGMAPVAPRFGLCATVDHANQDYKFGYSINIEG